MEKSKITCNSCGYPSNGKNKYCKVCGNNLRENKKVSLSVLKPSQIVAIVFIGFALVTAIVGLFGPYWQGTWWYKDDTVYASYGIKWFFLDGWKSIIEAEGDQLLINTTQFLLEFATYALAFVGIILCTINYFWSLMRRAQNKQTNFCVMKFFKFFALFTLPYVFMITFLNGHSIGGASGEEWLINIISFGWGILLIVIALAITFAATCISHMTCPCKKDEKAPFALKQVSVGFVIAFVILAFFASIGRYYTYEDGSFGFNKRGIFYYISLFILNHDVPIELGAMFITLFIMCLVALVAAIAFIFTKNKYRKIGYAGGLVVISVVGLILSHIANVGYYEFIGEEMEEGAAAFACSPTFIIAIVLSVVALTLTVIHTIIENKRVKKTAK